MPGGVSCSVSSNHDGSHCQTSGAQLAVRRRSVICSCHLSCPDADVQSHWYDCVLSHSLQDIEMTIKHNHPCYQMASTRSQTASAVGPPASLSRTLGLRSRRQAHCSWGSRASGVSKPGRGEGSFIRHDTAPSRSLSQLSTAAPVMMT